MRGAGRPASGESRAWSRNDNCCRRFSICPVPTSSRPEACVCRGTPIAITASASSPAISAPRCQRDLSPAPSRGSVMRASIARPRSCRGRPPRAAAKFRPLRPARAYLKHLAESWNANDRQGRGRPSARTAGHHPDGAGVVRRRRPRADRRSGPGRGLREPHVCWKSRRPRFTPGSMPVAKIGASR